MSRITEVKKQFPLTIGLTYEEARTLLGLLKEKKESLDNQLKGLLENVDCQNVDVVVLLKEREIIKDFIEELISIDL